jgi:IMP dehydrogenase
VGGDTDRRVEALVAAGVDVIVVDTAHGHSQGVLDRVSWVKKNFPNVQVIGGNIATGAAALALLDSGADASRSVSARARSAPPVSSPVSACRRSPPSIWWPKR